MGFAPTGATGLFPVVGDPITQVKSPSVLTRILLERGEDAVVVPMRVASAKLTGLFDALKCVQNVGGALVTVPHKQDAYALCSSHTERANFVEAVNVMRRSDAGWHGDNTDGIGYLEGIAREGGSVKGRRVLLVGCGGAGSAIALEILERGADQLAIHDIDVTRRDSIIDKLLTRFPGRVVVGDADPTGFEVVANATPLGMEPDDPLPIDVAKLQPSQFVACVVTKPKIPPLIAEARRLGCQTMTGATMFDAQAETLVDFLLGAGNPGATVE
ncbi:shikimate dehydrogenase [Agrobacterium arsenijevicii]|uniref:Shikimate dehydrogenase n=2 Tax=Agrobacterium arsenijevicii TaxID=1585697 RepID=A0ABR5CZ66_9HYPH|nr:shikimate dehydrogenase [Agrobacterium arsenijevicii]